MNTYESEILEKLYETPFVNQRVLAESFGYSVGVINRSDITLYAMKVYMERRANDISPAVV